MATFLFFDEFKANLGLAVINLNTDTFKVVLSDTGPTVGTFDELADITQITAGGGYSSGGTTAGSVTWAETSSGSAVWQFTSADVLFTASSGGTIATSRYAVLYSDTSTNDKLVGYLDRGSSATITSGNSRTYDVGASGWFQLT